MPLRRSQRVLINPLSLVLVAVFAVGGTFFTIGIPFAHGSPEAPFIAVIGAVVHFGIAVALWQMSIALVRPNAIRVNWPRSEWIASQEIAEITANDNGIGLEISVVRQDGSHARVARCSFGVISRMLVEDRVWSSVHRIRVGVGQARASDRLRLP